MIMNRRGANTYKKAPTMKFWAVFFCAFVTFPVNTKSFLAQQLGSRGRIESSRIVRSSSSSMEITIKDQPPLTEISAAELVARASNFQEVMVAIDSLAFPGEEKLHYQLQLVHQRKRQKVATNALKRLVKFLIGVSVETDRLQLIYSEKFYRLCVCATSSMTDNSSEEVTAFWLTRSDVKSYLEAIYSLGALAPLPQKVIIAISPLLQQLDRCCIDRDQGMKESIEQLPYNLKLKATEISSLDWAINRIYCDSSRQREPSHVMGKSISQASNAESITRAPLSEAKNILARREQLQLPFSILHGLVKGVTNVEEMRKMVPFKAETLQTKDGKTGENSCNNYLHYNL